MHGNCSQRVTASRLPGQCADRCPTLPCCSAAQVLSDEEAEALKARGVVVEEAAPPPRVDPAAEWDALLEDDAEQDISPEDLAAIGYSSVDEALAGLRTLPLPPGFDPDLLASAAELDGLLDDDEDDEAAPSKGEQERRRRVRRDERETQREKAVVCTRCHALQHTG